MSRVLIVVTHLLGVGHLARAAALARGLAASGHAVTVASGGRPARLVETAGFRLAQLPAVHCRGVDFRTLYDDAGSVAGDALLQRRKSLLVGLVNETRPEVLITETFPFGRRQLAAEFEAVLEAAAGMTPRPAILASIRDILNPPSKLAKARDAEDRLGRYYDAVLIHGDETVTPLSTSWPEAERLHSRLRYTGYIDAGAAISPPAGARAGVLVSGGGSAASLPLFRCALGAAALDASGAPWRILVGHGVGEDDYRTLAAAAGRASVERARSDFRSALAAAAVSVSQAGYNTVVDLAAAGTPAVLVPFEQGREAEQRLRAERLAAHASAIVLPENALSPEALLAAVERAKHLPPRPSPLRRDGIAGSIAAVEDATAERRRIEAAWTALDQALQQAGAAGRDIRVWWRDDDAVDDTPALRRLLALCERYGAPLSLAVIPAKIEPALARALDGRRDVTVLVHGYSHGDHAPPGRKKQELGYRPAEVTLSELSQGLAILRDAFGARVAPVLVPPWNRIDPSLLPSLPALGIAAVSTFGPAAQGSIGGPAKINTHVDPIAWHGSRSLADEADVVAKLTRLVASGGMEPIGLLTHHLVQDGWVWGFLERLLGVLGSRRAVRFVSLETVLPVSRQSES